MRSGPHVAGVILAAGEARRMGRCKLLLPYRGSTILGTVAAAARRSGLEPLVLVLGHDAARIRERMDLEGLVVTLNPAFRQGQSTSLRAALERVPPTCQGAMFLLGDQPRITPDVIESLRREFTPRTDRLVIPTAQGRRGNPVIVHRALFPRIRELRGDAGARSLFGRYSRRTRWVKLADDRLFWDVDTPEDYRRLMTEG